MAENLDIDLDCLWRNYLLGPQSLLYKLRKITSMKYNVWYHQTLNHTSIAFEDFCQAWNSAYILTLYACFNSLRAFLFFQKPYLVIFIVTYIFIPIFLFVTIYIFSVYSFIVKACDNLKICILKILIALTLF